MRADAAVRECRRMRIVIVGGGIGGLAAALALRREGFAPRCTSRPPNCLRSAQASRSGLTRSVRWSGSGWAAQVLARAGRIERALWLGRDGTTYKHFAFPETDSPAVALRRADLQTVLRAALPADSLQLGETFEGFTDGGGEVVARFEGGADIACDVLVGADGLHSRVRAQCSATSEPVYRGYSVWRGVARLEHASLPAADGVGGLRRGPALRRRAPSGSGARAGGRRRTSRRRMPEPPSEHGTEVSGHVRRLVRARARVDRGDAVRDDPSQRRIRPSRAPRAGAAGRVTLLGDAVHPMTPNLGQGGCMAVEDAAVLARCLAKYADARAALRAYESRRRTRAARVARYSRLYGASASGIARRHAPARARPLVRPRVCREKDAVADFRLRRIRGREFK